MTSTRPSYVSIPRLLAFALLVGAAACTSASEKHFKPKRFDTQEDAGSGHIAVLSVAPWDEFKKELQPTFTMTPDKALSQVVPTSMVMERKLLDLLKVVASVAPPKTGVSSSRTESSERTQSSVPGGNVKSDSVTESEGRTKESGEATAFTPTLPGGKSAAALPGRAGILDTELGMDPMARHTLATALYQEVKLLNHYVTHAVQRDGYTPYVVRVQASLLPKARNAPYDAWTSISFFPPEDGFDTPVFEEKVASARGLLLEDHQCKALFASLRQDPGTVPGVSYEFFKSSYLALENDLRRKRPDSERIVESAKLLRAAMADPIRRNQAMNCRCGGHSVGKNVDALVEKACDVGDLRTPVVVPLLVTDSMEASLTSNSTNVVRQYALALSALIKGFSLSANAESYAEELLTTVGNDYNSRYTVSRLSENTIRVRMGALLQATAQYAMVPQTKNITLLLLVPGKKRSRGAIPVISRTEFYDALSGEALPHRSQRDVQQLRADTFCSSASLSWITDPDAQEDLIRAVVSNDYPCFTRMYKKLAKKNSKQADRDSALSQQAWVALTSVLVGSQYASAKFSLPKGAELEAPIGHPSSGGAVDGGGVVGLDDGKSKMTIRIIGGKALNPAKLSAIVKVKGLPISGTITVLKSPSGIQVTIPSLSLLSAGTTDLSKAATAELFLKHPNKTTKYTVQVVKQRSKPKDPAPGITVNALPALRASAAATGTLPVRLSIPKPAPKGGTKVKLAFKFSASSGAATGRVSSVANGAVVVPHLNDPTVTIPAGKKKFELQVSLEQLQDGSKLKIEATLKGKPASCEVLIAVPKQKTSHHHPVVPLPVVPTPNPGG